MRTEARGPQVLGTVPSNRLPLFVVLVALTLWIDLYSKHEVFRLLGVPGRGPDWYFAGDAVRFRLETSFNPGALWGVGQNYTWVFTLLSVAAAIGIVYWLFVKKGAESLWLTIALGLIGGGTLGNLYDRLGLHGYRELSGDRLHAVRDFLYFRFFDQFDWAIFNLADSFLVIGAAMLVIQSFRTPLVEPVAVAPNPAADSRSSVG